MLYAHVRTSPTAGRWIPRGCGGLRSGGGLGNGRGSAGACETGQLVDQDQDASRL